VRDASREVAGSTSAGAIRSCTGLPSGLTATESHLWTQNDLPGATAEKNDFGASFAAADFNSDGFGDVAVGAPGEDTITRHHRQARVTDRNKRIERSFE